MEPANETTLRAALTPSALREALQLRRPVFANPWDSEADMGACYAAVAVVIPGLLWSGGKLMGLIFSFGSHWRIGVFMVAALVGAAGFITIVGRERTRLSVDVLAIAAWLILGFVLAPIVGLAPPTAVSIACYAALLAGIFLYVLLFGHWKTAFLRTVSWPMTWSLLAVLFAFLAHRLILYQ
jgi:MFS superfamily sulfate permease-like transporter